VKFVELGFPDVPAAVASGKIDAGFVVEPLLSIGISQGLRPVAGPYVETDPGLSVAGWFTSQAYIDAAAG
jgi:NitT/TauT family transport system substrate-binding protein